jgi:hypothetical protein
MYFWGAFDFSTPLSSCADQLAFPARFPALPTDNIVEAAAGKKFLIVLSADAKLYGLGSNHSQQLGTSVGAYTSTFRQLCVETRFPVVQIACGAQHTLLRCQDGSVYSAGDNEFGQLGRKSKSKDFSQVQLPANIVSVACGSTTSFAINSTGQVFSWGDAQYGSLGHGDRGQKLDPVTLREVTENIHTPKVIEWFVKKRISISRVAAGLSHTLFQSQSEVYSCGEGYFGKLGNGDIEAMVLPTRVEFPMRKETEELMEIAAGKHHSLVRKRDSLQQSVIYFFGKRGANADGWLSPTRVVEAPLNVTHLLGGDQISVALTADGRLYAWGLWPAVRAIGLTNEATLSVPSLMSVVADYHVTRVVGGFMFLACFADDSKAKRPEQLDVVVPFAFRQDNDVARRYEEFAQLFYRRTLGEGPGSQYFQRIPVAPPKPVAQRPDYTKTGTSRLTRGAKVRLWMTDVYALGVIGESAAAAQEHHGRLHGTNMNKSQQSQKSDRGATPEAVAPGTTRSSGDETTASGKKFLVEWSRDDWCPELLELDSDDETLDEANPNRWQHGWFLESPPASSSAM